MPEMPVSEKTVLLRECNSDVFSIGYSNQDNDSFLQTGICLLLFESSRRNSVPEATTLLHEMYVPKCCFHVIHGGSHVIHHVIHVVEQPLAWSGL